MRTQKTSRMFFSSSLLVVITKHLAKIYLCKRSTWDRKIHIILGNQILQHQKGSMKKEHHHHNNKNENKKPSGILVLRDHYKSMF